MKTQTQTDKAAGFKVSEVTPELIKYAWSCANEYEFASVQKLSCADVRGLLTERAALLAVAESLTDDIDHSKGRISQSTRQALAALVAVQGGAK